MQYPFAVVIGVHSLFTYEYTYAAVNSKSENLLCGPYLNYTYFSDLYP